MTAGAGLSEVCGGVFFSAPWEYQDSSDGAGRRTKMRGDCFLFQFAVFLSVLFFVPWIPPFIQLLCSVFFAWFDLMLMCL